MSQQNTLMKFDPATGEPEPYPSHAGQWREWHGKAMAWLFNPWDGTCRDARDVGGDTFGRLIQPPGETVCAAECNAPLETVEARYKDLLNALGVSGHSGAIEEIGALRRRCKLDT